MFLADLPSAQIMISKLRDNSIELVLNKESIHFSPFPYALSFNYYFG